MFTTQATTSNSLIKTIDFGGALTVTFNKNSPKWKAMKKFKKGDKMATLSFIGESFWNTVKEVKSTITDSIEKSIRYSAISLLQHLSVFNESVKSIDKIEPAVPTKTKVAMANAEVCDNFYAALHLNCLKCKMTPPIILYGRLFEEERFQYVSFIIGRRVFIIEMTIGDFDVQERACETMCTLIRKFGDVPKVSSFIKVLQNVAHLVAEIDVKNETLELCKMVPDDLEILNLNEIKDLIVASDYLSKKPRKQIEENCAQTLFYKQPFLEGFHVNRKNVFGCVDPLHKNICPSSSSHPIILVFCDTVTQSNFLWNDKPLTVNVKQLMAKVNCLASKMSYQQLELLPLNAVPSSNECGGIRYGDQILYDGPLVIVFD